MTTFLNNITKYSVVSIIGLAKNVSKTTTLNYIIKNLKGYKLGLTSIGRDGEKYDIITQLPKPRILIKKGTIVATARQSYEASEVEMELLKTTEFNTPIGEVLILKALTDGLVELAGPSTNKNLKKLCLELKNLGCDLILIDGAFDRRSYATPVISDATILSTGASVSEDMQNVINLTIHTISLLNLKSEEKKEISELALNIFKKAKVGILDNQNNIKLLKVPTPLDAAKEISKKLDENARYVIIKGAITDNLLEDLMKFTEKYKGVTFLLEDAAKIFLSQKVMEKFQKKGGIIKVLHSINVIAVTINPTSPLGYQFDKINFLNLMKKHINVPVFDLGSGT
ncbi:MAG: hypothetical protein JSV62_00790 [Promethearchaeota archaeon]|nr:MAG: hypothetical protein JSV62_00790 [Candidatus Lokiarchaeota archaeon]